MKIKVNWLVAIFLSLVSFSGSYAADIDSYDLYLVDTDGSYISLGLPDIRSISFRQVREDLDGDGTNSYENYLVVNKVDGTSASFNITHKKMVLFDEASSIVGDVNDDKSVDINDVVCIINQMAGTAVWAKANVNGDPNVDINDVVSVINIMAGAELYVVGADLPDNVYLCQSKSGSQVINSVQIYHTNYLQKVNIAKANTVASLAGRNDSLQFVLSDGLHENFLIREVDSILFHAPDSLMRAYLAYRDKNLTKYYPTYSDDYRNIAGWNSRANWQLANIHDPTVMKAADGYYYMSQTDAGFGNPMDGKGHFYVRRSKDMINWEPASTKNNSMVLPQDGPYWLLDSVNAVRARRGVSQLTSLSGLGFWAPTMRKVNDHLYRMYYSVVIGNGIKTGSPDFDGSWNEPAWIGLAETTDPASGVWTDKGGVLCSASDKGKSAYARSSESDYNAYARFNAIDPSYIITPEGEHWLIYGSWHSGIAAIELDPETGFAKVPVGDPWNIGTGQTTTHGKLIATRNKASRWQGSEGAEIIYNPETGYYYLFLAYDGLDVPYNTRVVRSKNVNGPFLGKDGKNVTTTGGDAFPIITHPYQFSSSLEHDGWVGISHCAVWDDGKGNWFFSSQGRKPNDYSTQPEWAPNAIMMGHVRRIYWTEDGWPVVSPERYAGVIGAPISRDDLIGDWELIDLSYQYGVQKTPSTLTMKASSVSTQPNRLLLSGAITGAAVLDPESNTLQITAGTNKFTVCLARELDWEATKRVSTIVFAGYPSATATYWAKKVQ